MDLRPINDNENRLGTLVWSSYPPRFFNGVPPLQLRFFLTPTNIRLYYFSLTHPSVKASDRNALLSLCMSEDSGRSEVRNEEERRTNAASFCEEAANSLAVKPPQSSKPCTMISASIASKSKRLSIISATLRAAIVGAGEVNNGFLKTFRLVDAFHTLSIASKW